MAKRQKKPKKQNKIWELYDASSSLQRKRKFCPKCVAPHELHKDEIEALRLTEEEMKDAQPMLGVGCKLCDGGGYKGRMGLFEVLEIEDQIRRMIIEERPVGHLRDFAVEHGYMKTLRNDGVRKVVTGQTSVAEVMRVTSSDEH